MDGNDDDDDVDIILDHRVMNPTSSSSGSMLIGLNQFNIGTSDEPKKLSKEKWIILVITCTSIGMFNGLGGPTLSYLSESIPSIVWLITIKSIGFLIGIYLSSYLFHRFNIYCLLGISCFSISFSVCALPFLTNSIIFYFVSLILGIGLGLVYHGIDVLYTRVCNQSSICWLHLLIPLGAILSTLLLFSSTMSSIPANTTHISKELPRLRRAISNDSISLANQSSGSDIRHSNNTNYQILPICANETDFDCLKELNNSTTVPTFHKMNSIFHSISSIHYLYLLLALLFFILGIFYSKLAIKRERVTSSSITNLNPLPLIIAKPYRIVSDPNIQISLFSDRLSNALFILIIYFYFILSGIENSCFYLTYSFGIALKLSKNESLFLQLLYLLGRFIDLSVNYTWFSFKKQTDQFPLKHFIILRLIILFLLSLFHLFQHFTQILFFSIGFFLASLSTLLLFWLKHNFYLNDVLLRMILFSIVISESIFPIVLFHHFQHFLPIFLLIALCFLMISFFSILYLTQKWQEDRSYRLLTTSMEAESRENSDNE